MAAGDRRERFVQEYLVDRNATKAAERSGYSAKTAASIGHELLRKPEIQAAIRKAEDVRAKRTEVTADRVVRELAFIAFADIGDVIDSVDGKVTIRDLKSLPRQVRRAIGEITQTDDGGKVKLTIKHHSKTTALRMLMDHLGMDAPKETRNEHTLSGIPFAELVRLSKLGGGDD